MLQYQKLDVSEGIDVNKTSASKECELFHYWFFKDIGFKFEEHLCNRNTSTFRCISIGISKNEALKRLDNSVTYDRGVL